jgi:hypothetical protein
VYSVRVGASDPQKLDREAEQPLEGWKSDGCLSLAKLQKPQIPCDVLKTVSFVRFSDFHHFDVLISVNWSGRPIVATDHYTVLRLLNLNQKVSRYCVAYDAYTVVKPLPKRLNGG